MTIRILGTAYLAWQLRGQSRYPFRPLAGILRDQGRRVRAMAAYAYRYVPYYRETLDRLGLTPRDFRTAEDLTRLPVIETADYQRDPEYYLSTAAPKSAYLAMPTSGSTGRPRVIYHDWREVAQNAAHAERERSMVAALVEGEGYRETVFVIAREGSHPHVVQQMLRRHVWLPKEAGSRRQYLSILDPVEENVARINEFQPNVINTAAYLGPLFGYLQRTGAPCHLPKVVTSGTEGVSEAVRRMIMEEFRIPVLSTYQATEAFKLGFECGEHRGYHLNLDLYPVRLADPEGRTVPEGETGEVVLSNLVNRATVLLNYRLNDLAAAVPGPCPCGRTLPMISFLRGRHRDWLYFDSGKSLHPAVTNQFFTEQPGLWQYQVVQHSGAHVSISVVAAPSVDREQARERLAQGFQAMCGEGVRVDLAFVERIPCTPGGKIRPVVARDDGQYRA